jgi:hypothetical protein
VIMPFSFPRHTVHSQQELVGVSDEVERAVSLLTVSDIR